MARRWFLGWIACALLLGACTHVSRSSAPVAEGEPSVDAPSSEACTSFCLDNGDHCVFGTNQDNSVDRGLVTIMPRYVLKTGWDAGTTGSYARWISRYGSVTFEHGGYQMAWAGMNEAGLMMSTMALVETENPQPDERPPLISSFWMQYQLDNHATVEEVIASDAYLRIADTVDHYLVCDRTGDCAVIEFLEGQMVYHRGDALPVAALANSTYPDSLRGWEEGRASEVKVDWVQPGSPAAEAGMQAGDWITSVDGVPLDSRLALGDMLSNLRASYAVGDQMQLGITRPGVAGAMTVTVTLGARTTEEGEEVPTLGAMRILAGTSMGRFATAAQRLAVFEPTGSEDAVAYAFDTLQAVASDNTAWSIVFDPASLRVSFRTHSNREVRTVDLGTLDFSCRVPVRMLDVHADLSGDIGAQFAEYSHAFSQNHTLAFLEERGQQEEYPAWLVEVLLRGAESFPCVEGDARAEARAGMLLVDSQPRLPPRVTWAARALAYRLWALWALLGPVGLLAYVVVRRRWWGKLRDALARSLAS